MFQQKNLFATLWYSTVGGLIAYNILQPPTWYLNLSFSQEIHNVSYASLLLCGLYVSFETWNVVRYLLQRKEDCTYTDEFHVIIPCHELSESDLLQKIANLTSQNNIDSYRIWIADNGVSENHNKIAYKICIQHGVHYLYYPIASKTHALYETVLHIQRCCPKPYVMLLDDDTVLPSNFKVRTDLFMTNKVAGYSCAIGVLKNNSFNLWQHLIDFEYRSISWRNEIKSQHSTISFLHGIICIYRTDAFLEIYRFNPCLPPGHLPFGEDSYAGLIARTHGWLLKQDNTQCVLTYCPSTLFAWNKTSYEQGYGASSLFKQRALRWYLSWPRRFMNELGLLFFYDTYSWIGNLSYRADFLKYCLITFSSTFWFLYLIKLIVHRSNFVDFALLHCFFMIISQIMGYMRYFTMSSVLKEHVQWYVPLLYPLLLWCNSMFMGVSFLLSIFWYIPLYRRL